MLGTETGPHVFVDDLDVPVVSEEDRHHLARVLRIRPGDALTVSDGRGRWRPCRFGQEVEPVGPVETAPTPEPRLTVAFALVKGERPELVVQKLTELGIDRIVPFVAARSVVRWDDERGERHLARLRRVAREASMQSRRCHLPDVEPVTTFAEVLARPRLALADQGGPPPAPGICGVLIGPEGGWTAEERAAAAVAGVPSLGFADQVLRAETAAIAAAALLGALRSGVVREPPVAKVAN